jgi:raffinose/stachyose/melibiose transport system substrate-binding protein
MKRKRIQYLSLLLTAVLLVICLAGCGGTQLNSGESSGQEAEPSGSKTSAKLTVWMFNDMSTPGDYYITYWKNIEQETGYRITVRTYSTQQLKDKLKIGVATKELPDIFTVWGGSYPEFLFDARACTPVQNYLKESNTLFKEAYRQTYTDGNNYIIPCFPEAYSVLLSNDNLLKKLDLSVPRNWQQLIQFVQDVRQYNAENGTDYTPIELGDKDNWAGDMLYSTIVNRIDPDAIENLAKGKTELDSEPFRQACERIRELTAADAFPKDFLEMGDTEAVENFRQGKALLMVNQSPILQYLQTNMGEDNFSVNPFPSCSSSHDKDYARYNLAINYSLEPGLCINSYSNYKDEAAEACLKFADAVNRINVAEGGYIDITDKNIVAPLTIAKPTRQLRDMLFYSKKDSPYLYSLLEHPQADDFRSMTKKLYAGEYSTETFLREAEKYLKFSQIKMKKSY